MLRSVALSAVIVAVLSLCGTVGSTIWRVHPDSTISSIQTGIDSSSTGDTVLVYPETYVENISFNGKNIVLGSLFLMTGDTSYISSTIIDGDSSGTVVTFENGEDSTAVTTGFTIQNGYAASGGGIRCYNNSNPSLANVTISGNTAVVGLLEDSYGGGIYCYNSSPSLTNVTVSKNTADYGGGFALDNSSPSLTNVTVSENTADDGGGFGLVNSNPSLTNVTMSGNTADYGGGGGIHCCASSGPSLVNCIFWNDAPDEIYFFELWPPNTITISYSDIQGDSAGIVTNDNGTVYWLEGNIDEDPLFADTANADFSLTQDSPCIDAGTPDTTGLSLPPSDILGNQRIWDGDGDQIAIIDMGAYEYGAPAVGIEHYFAVEPKTQPFLHNYPNPFSPQTSIRYGLGKDGRVSLKVYSLLGQQICVLVDKFKESGLHTTMWDGRDDTGRKVSCGTYFLRLEAHTGPGTRHHIRTRKVCVVR